jgi:DNA replicative helicase MCM subunit Mcm2 (Cdc46/Mcm family)
VFDANEPVWKQIGLPKDFIDRFDLVIPLDNLKTEEEQKKIAGIIFKKLKKEKQDISANILDKNFLIKYIAYARQKVYPEMTPEAEEYITLNFINLVKPSGDKEPAYFSSRLIMNLVRLATASAKCRLSNIVEVKDALVAINLLISSFKKQNIIQLDGLTDIEKLEAVIPKTKRDKMKVLLSFIKEACENNMSEPGKYADILDIVNLAKSNGFPEEDIDECISKLKQAGDLIEVRPNKYKTL